MNPAHYPAFVPLGDGPVLLCADPHDPEHLRRLLAAAPLIRLSFDDGVTDDCANPPEQGKPAALYGPAGEWIADFDCGMLAKADSDALGRLLAGLNNAAPALLAAAREHATLTARVAELEATLANERGEGEAPSVGWRWEKTAHATETGGDEHGWYTDDWIVCRSSNGWVWDEAIPAAGQPARCGMAPTARAAMIAADAIARGEHREG